ncbi:TrmB family transcriptional regulator [Roseateles sp.]|uniref:TrmB family transcriptional regulator n=1 Tax=Roseateles sp. TaxID=1971397 RepID=UPI0039E8D0F6
MSDDDLQGRALLPFGFTELESRVYCALLSQSPATGYKLARAVGKAAANTYQALAVLVQKGAVIGDESEPRSFRPVPPAELFSRLRHSFDEQAQVAEQRLSALFAPSPEDRLYQLKNLPQALERARTLIASARETLLFDLFPMPLAQLRPELDAAHARGVLVGGTTYEPLGDAGFTHLLSPGAGSVAERWPGHQITLIADGREVLLALVAPNGLSLHHGFWSDSAYLACLHHSGLAAEMRLSATLAEGATDPLRRFGLLSAAPDGLRGLVGREPESVA